MLSNLKRFIITIIMTTISRMIRTGISTRVLDILLISLYSLDGIRAIHIGITIPGILAFPVLITRVHILECTSIISIITATIMAITTVTTVITAVTHHT